ncbi:hypothetical protein ABT09_02440 [bacterium SCN 57-13]|nr:MAG: hypothetical protein ABT09_02440 [bacterium SCN 57-13]
MIGASVLAVCAFAFDDAAKAKAQIQTEMSKYATAIKKKDAAGLEKIIKANFSEDFKDTDSKGNVRNREQTIQAMKQNITMLKTVKSVSVKVEKLTIKGGTATSNEHMVMKAVIAGPDPKQTATLDVDSSWVSTYVKKGAKWICTASKGGKEKVLINGKPIG